MSFDIIPDDLILAQLQYMQFPEILKLKAVNKLFESLCDTAIGRLLNKQLIQFENDANALFKKEETKYFLISKAQTPIKENLPFHTEFKPSISSCFASDSLAKNENMVIFLDEGEHSVECIDIFCHHKKVAIIGITNNVIISKKTFVREEYNDQEDIDDVYFDGHWYFENIQFVDSDAFRFGTDMNGSFWMKKCKFYGQIKVDGLTSLYLKECTFSGTPNLSAVLYSFSDVSWMTHVNTCTSHCHIMKCTFSGYGCKGDRPFPVIGFAYSPYLPQSPDVDIFIMGNLFENNKGKLMSDILDFNYMHQQGQSIIYRHIYTMSYDNIKVTNDGSHPTTCNAKNHIIWKSRFT